LSIEEETVVSVAELTAETDTSFADSVNEENSTDAKINCLIILIIRLKTVQSYGYQNVYTNKKLQ